MFQQFEFNLWCVFHWQSRRSKTWKLEAFFLASQRPGILSLLLRLNFWRQLMCFVWHNFFWHSRYTSGLKSSSQIHLMFRFFATDSNMYLFMGTRSWWCIEMVVLVVMYRWWWSTGKKSSCSLEEAASNQTWCLHEELHMICLYFL